MKKMILPTLLIMYLTGMISCRKSEPRSSPEKPGNVTTWLNDQKKNVPASDSNRINTLLGSLDLSRTRPESLNRDKHFLVVPVKQEFKPGNNAKVLLLKQTTAGNIEGAYIVEYTGFDRDAKLPENCFTGIYKSEPKNISGKFLFSSITQRPRFEFTYQKGEMLSYSIIRKKDSPGFASKVPQDPISPAPANCIDWYWLTTTIYADGHTEQTQRFAFTTCEQAGGSGEGNGSECCIPDGDMSISSTQTNEDQHTNCVPTKSTSRYPTKVCTTDWIFYKNRLILFYWNWRSYETSIAEQINGVWKFKPGSIVHSSISMEGQQPPCLSFTCTVTSSMGSISGDGTMAYMDLTANSTVESDCIGKSSKGESVYGRTFWHAG